MVNRSLVVVGAGGRIGPGRPALSVPAAGVNLTPEGNAPSRGRLSDIRTTTPAADAPTSADWARVLGSHWRRLQLLKALGICAFIALFFSAYFHLLHHPVNPVTVMPLTPLDSWIGFVPAAFWPYASLWFYVGVAPAFQPSLRALLGYGAWAFALCLAGLMCFYLWPTVVPSQAHQLDPSVAHHLGFALMRDVDTAGNACPSMHVATAAFSALWIHRLLAAVRGPAWLQRVNAGWFLLIAWSTVAVHQHVVLDVLAGAALGMVFGLASLCWGPAPRPAAPLAIRPTARPTAPGQPL
ncbi:MAG: phosphatase PAP2 family protein [Rubrivivax sp.]|nr:phosphatase PAP2 family protein [Rubrivivax sp.]MBK7264533.1 phosphatase PAP2 family protein [Rubrivivax sp.]MBK8530010.1 phosphatase PAP2 family protein [Rubrivivax sp.]